MQVTIITGASSGIGLELAKCFANDGHPLLLISRNEERLLQLQKELNTLANIYILSLDLTKSDFLSQVISFMDSHNLEIQYLVNNAGLGDYGKFELSNLDKQIDMVKLNQLALMTLTHQFLPKMLAKNSGGILNVASIGSFIPGPLMSIYYATKAFVLSFTQAIAEENKASNVRIMALCPGPTKTDFFKNANMNRSSGFTFKHAMDAKKVASKGYYKFINKKNVIYIPGFLNKTGIFLTRFIPMSTTRKIAYKIQK